MSEQKGTNVSLGGVDKVIDLLGNPTRDKLRETTYINRYQASLFPLLDTLNRAWDYVIAQSWYIANKAEYKKRYPELAAAAKKVRGKSEEPLPPDLADELLVRISQWNRSIAGRTVEKMSDLALAQIESQMQDDNYADKADSWGEKK